MAEEKKYKVTLNLPQTDFPIKANLAKVEEEFLGKWAAEDIYRQAEAKAKAEAKGTYLLHDGPPYPNGDIHLGHALNKVLKDIIVKYKAMSGFYAPYVPGWDCHGLPIETQLLKEIGDKRKIMSIMEFREHCKQYALKYVDLQRKEFKKLGVFGDWDKPYLTIDHEYEAKIIELFGDLAEKGYVYRGLKPIHWCPTDQTALAEAEIEYEDDRSPSIYVKFPMSNVPPLADQMKDVIRNPNLPTNIPWSLIIWTTTPWTLPANVAVAAHPDYEYVILLVKRGNRDVQSQVSEPAEEVYIVAEGLLNNFVEKLGLADHVIVDKVKGKILEGMLCRHPFIDREVPVVNDEYVTLEQGTGFVHIAPGHGAEDYKVGLSYKLPIVMPVDERGYFDQTVPDFIKGKHYDESNKLITEKMQENGSLLKLEFFKHPYPHCWRCKKPVIFRATEQWFISVEHKSMRQEALKAIGGTKWFPAWGENRIRGMVETRPDWCVSRQRAWGVPIPAFYCKKCGKPSLTGVFNKAIRELVLKEGTNGWFAKEAKEILPAGTKCPFCGHTEFRKETDILDVWFESGSSFAAVIDGQADLYLEGSDQHRGWFQSSLLLGVGHTGRAPFKAVLTHGFTIDDKGKKMSKSLGNVIDPNDVVKRYGADVLRLWVASTDFRNDMAASEKILKQVQEAYTKIRNTCRFLLSNLGDYSLPTTPYSLLEIDKWILLKLNRLVERCLKAYNEFEFHQVYHGLYDFCVNDLSAFYLDMSKDRLYCGGKDSVERRSAQFAMREILTTLVKLMAPILSFTAEDIYRHIKGPGARVQGPESIFLQDIPKANEKYLDEKIETKWQRILEIRSFVYTILEEKRAAKVIGANLDATLELGLSEKDHALIKSVEDQLEMIFIASKVALVKQPAVSGGTIQLLVEKKGEKCARCWRWREDVGQTKEHPTLCARCAAVVKGVPA
jgi:isoleucyl-tRNA synthetase